MSLAEPQTTVPRPEYPRPDFERKQWLNLNGRWQFELDPTGDGVARGLTSGKNLSGTIVVPFCPESKLSGIGNTDFMSDLWYRRQVQLPNAMKGKRLLLNFGAVDWLAHVWVNGKMVGEHKGGYSSFALDVTDAMKDGANEIVVHAFDDVRSGKQATGKQCHDAASNGCVYTRTSGIWQTVWLETAGESYLRELQLEPDLDGGRVFFRGWVDGPQKDVTLRAVASVGGKVVGEETVAASWKGTRGVIKLAKVTPWESGTPFLYDLRLEVRQGGKVLDTVHSYFGLRKIAIEGNRFLINGKPVFQRLILDQGFWPDGIYTAPTDAEIKKDIELSMAAGFNGARLHQKVFEPRTLYWADKLGYLLWGEYPSWGLDLKDYKAVADAMQEWREVLERDRNHPAIIGWCPLNETAGSDDVAAAQSLFAITQAADPSRPYLDTSGYVHLFRGTDVFDSHDYDQNPESFKARYATFGETGQRAWTNSPTRKSPYAGQPYFVSEYGGMRLKTDRTTGEGWGYGETDLKEFLARYKGLTDVLLDNPNMFGFCYTQLTDVEQEQNGIYFYDRAPKYDPKLLKAINARAAAYETQGPKLQKTDWIWVARIAPDQAETWRYTTDAPTDGWMQTSFDDSGWKSGPAGFGVAGTPGAVIGTEWNTPDIWLRREFTISDVDTKIAALDIHHDEEAEVYVNGTLIANLQGYTTDYDLVHSTAALKIALRPGKNVIAVHCHQTRGGQYIDVGIVFGKRK